MPIIRKKLWAGELSSEANRTNPTTGEFETSPDGGTTWIPAPEADPRIGDQFRLPPLGAGSACNAAARMVAHIQEQLETAIAFEGKASIATSFLFGLGLILIATQVGALFGVLLLVADAILSIGVTTVISAMTSGVYDDLECIIYCNLDDNGQMSAAQAENIREDVDAQIGGVAATVINLMFDTFGQVGLSNAAVVRSETGDCSGCPTCTWCKTWDFNVDPGDGWSERHVATCQWGAFWLSGQGWLAKNGYAESISIRYQLPVETTFTRLQYHSDHAGSGPFIGVWANSDISGTEYFRYNAKDTGAIDETVPAGSWLFFGLQSTGGSCGAHTEVNIDSATVEGTGENPFGESDC